MRRFVSWVVVVMISGVELPIRAFAQTQNDTLKQTRRS